MEPDRTTDGVGEDWLQDQQAAVQAVIPEIHRTLLVMFVVNLGYILLVLGFRHLVLLQAVE